jgi:hypothetical protein
VTLGCNSAGPVRCLPDCPNGFSCTADNVCRGGDLQNLEVEVVRHPVHVTLTSNGARAKALPGCDDGSLDESTVWRVTFTEMSRGDSITREGYCDLSPFDLSLVPGTYKVRAGGDPTKTNLPGFGEVIIDALEVAGPKPRVVLDVVSSPVHVTVEANGTAAKALPECDDGSFAWLKWRVTFTEKSRGYTFTRQGDCDTLMPFDLTLFPGTYEVRAGGDPRATNLPGFDQVVIDALEVKGPQPDLVLDVVSHPVHVILQASGAPAKALPGCDDGKYFKQSIWRVTFVEKSRGYTITRKGNCDDLKPFDLSLFPGVYQVSGGGSETDTNLPGFQHVVIDALEVKAQQPDLVLDIVSYPAHVTVKANGALAKALPECGDEGFSESMMWRVMFTEKSRGFTISREGDCNDLTPFDVSLSPGTYEVRAGGHPTDTNLPGYDQVIIDALEVKAPQPDLVLDVVSHPAHVTIKSNGALAKALPECDDGPDDRGTKWRVTFTDTSRGYTITRKGNCDDLKPFVLGVFPGTYEVRAGGDTTGTNLPGFDEVVIEALEVKAEPPDLVLDVVSRPVHVTLNANGAPAKAHPDCDERSHGDLAWRVEFTEKGRGYTFGRQGSCGDLAPFDLQLFPGIYEVRAGGQSWFTNLPAFDMVVIAALAVP